MTGHALRRTPGEAEAAAAAVGSGSSDPPATNANTTTKNTGMLTRKVGAEPVFRRAESQPVGDAQPRQRARVVAFDQPSRGRG